MITLPMKNLKNMYIREALVREIEPNHFRVELYGRDHQPFILADKFSEMKLFKSLSTASESLRKLEVFTFSISLLNQQQQQQG